MCLWGWEEVDGNEMLSVGFWRYTVENGMRDKLKAVWKARAR